MIFVSIDDHEVHDLRMLMNEVFGEENFLAQVVWQKVYSPRMDAKGYSADHDYILVYGRSESVEAGKLAFRQNLRQFSLIDQKTGQRYRRRSLRKEGKNSRRADRPNLFYPIQAPDGSKLLPIRPDGSEGCWRWAFKKYEEAEKAGLIEWVRGGGGWQVYVRQFFDESPEKPPSTLWLHSEVGHNHEAVEEIRSLFGAPVMDNPKPTRLVRRMMELTACSFRDGEFIVLDFFAGSCTTAHVALTFARENQENVRFIMIQLPEPTYEGSTARRVGFSSIADIGKERIRRVIAKLREEEKGKLDLKTRDTPEDLGFRVFKLTESHYKPWATSEDKDPEAYAKQMQFHLDPLIPGWKPENLIWEVAIKEGYGLNSRVEPPEQKGSNTFYRVTDPNKDQSFLICLDRALKPEAVRALGLSKEDLFVCRDVALDDELAANLALQCRLKTI